MTLVPGIEQLVSALLEKDQHVLHHSERASRYASIIGCGLGLKGGQLSALQRGGILHDLGKLAVPQSILQKADTLNNEEWEIMRRHPEDGHARLVGRLDDPALEVVLYHHEWYDGRGYPGRIKGDDIPILARVFSIADAFDAMTSDRPSRKAMSPFLAREEVLLCAGIQFDPILVEVFSFSFDEIMDSVHESVQAAAIAAQAAVVHVVERAAIGSIVPIRPA